MACYWMHDSLEIHMPVMVDIEIKTKDDKK